MPTPPATAETCPCCRRPLPDSPRARALDLVAGKRVTPRQLELLVALLAHQDAHDGMPPRLFDLAAVLKVSRVTCWEHVRALCAAGVLRKVAGKAVVA